LVERKYTGSKNISEEGGGGKLPETIGFKKGWCSYCALSMERSEFRKVFEI
jgi:hypothetical protein